MVEDIDEKDRSEMAAAQRTGDAPRTSTVKEI